MAAENQFRTHEMNINFSHPKIYQPRDDQNLSNSMWPLEINLEHMISTLKIQARILHQRRMNEFHANSMRPLKINLYT